MERPLINVFHRVYFDFFVFLVFIGIIGGPLINVFMRVYFDFFFWFVCFFVCGGGVIGIIGGTPDKRTSEGLV